MSAGVSAPMRRPQGAAGDGDQERTVGGASGSTVQSSLRCPPKEGTIIGWVLQTDDDTDAEPVIALAEGLCDLREHEVPRQGQAEHSWLNEANPHEAAFVEMMQGHLLVSDPRDQYRFLAVSDSAYQAIQRATDDLHGLFMHATDWVLQDEARLRPFNLPTALWPRLRLFWADRRNQMITKWRVRVDASPVITSDSDLLPLRVLDDERHLQG